MRTLRILLCGTLACLLPILSNGQDSSAVKPDSMSNDQMIAKATEAALSWLAEVDAGSYAESWSHAAVLFKNAVSESSWVAQLTEVRTPLGKLSTRQFTGGQYTTMLPMGPDGEYVVIQFKSVFANMPEATETVTPMKDPDGVWRVAGYYIRP